MTEELLDSNSEATLVPPSRESTAMTDPDDGLDELFDSQENEVND